ncbi:MAG: hypothetical protein GY754_38480 [bacterium]|nr:hypothetical protein [bacterium]
MPRKNQNNLHFESTTRYEEGISPDLDDTERETLVRILKEIILNLPPDLESGEECYSSNVVTEQGQFCLMLYGYEMRALRTLFRKVK